ncbi:MAG: hypothetical protein O7D30_03400, partial [Rickettsia endosymbiont of Ixodes persulcatus]|nr:hypothetical protein [Rickettsia endosymbiont of Ixodes persulcatus]
MFSEKLAHEYLSKLSKWLQRNCLYLSTSKTNYIIFKPQNKREYNFINIALKWALEERHFV